MTSYTETFQKLGVKNLSVAARVADSSAQISVDGPVHIGLERPAQMGPPPVYSACSRGAASRSKRFLDIVIAASAIVAFLPLLVLIALMVRLESSGPVIFRQKRGGLAGGTFEIFKFRTMYVVEPHGSMGHATKSDPRVTRIGVFLRRSSLDELPQLFNVLRGEMSIVGPRPHAIYHDEYYSALIPNYVDRNNARPGLTGLAQVSGYRGEIHNLDSMHGRIDCDLRYVENWSMALDLKIIFKTIIHAPFDPQAY